MSKDTGEDIEVGTKEGLETVQVAKNRSDNFLKTEKEKVREGVRKEKENCEQEGVS